MLRGGGVDVLYFHLFLKKIWRFPQLQFMVCGFTVKMVLCFDRVLCVYIPALWKALRGLHTDMA